METISCDTDNLYSNVLLPPRKRLLAGLKKQNLNGNFNQPSASSKIDEFDNRLNNLMCSHLENPNLSLEEIVEASRTEAASAHKKAVKARSVAEEKAEIAAKAMAVAKKALDLVASVSENEANNERYLKKNRMKKHLPVQMLYYKHQLTVNSKTDEELARNLHRAMNSSPRISKNPSTSGLKSNRQKRLKGLANLEGNPSRSSNENCLTDEVDSEDSIHEAHTVRVYRNSLKFNKPKSVEMDVVETGTSHLKENKFDDMGSIGRKRGRMKQKKLPLSICSFRGRANSVEEMKSERSPLTEESKKKPILNGMPASSVEPLPDGVEKSSMWKCKAFKATVSVAENKAMQS